MRDKKATADDDAPVDVLKLLVEDDHKLMTTVTGEWPYSNGPLGSVE
jgi:hypothetical protein